MSDWQDTEAQGMPHKLGFNPDYAGKYAECDGGMHVTGNLSGRQDFTGVLTGDYRDYGEYPWRWYLMKDLVHAPEGYGHDAVWCDEGSLILLDRPPA